MFSGILRVYLPGSLDYKDKTIFLLHSHHPMLELFCCESFNEIIVVFEQFSITFPLHKKSPPFATGKNEHQSGAQSL